MKVNINELKREHNALLDEGRRLYTRITQCSDRMNEIQTLLTEAEGDDYDPIPLIFGDGFFIREDDEDKVVEV